MERDHATDLSSRSRKVSSEILAANLRLLRNMAGISQQRLATSVGLKRNNIASYESAVVEPSPERLLALARFFKVDPLLLITENLTEHPLEKLSGQQFPPKQESLTEELDTFIAQTMDLQKVIEGFKEFHKVKKQQQESKEDPALNSLNNDFENLLEILKKLLDTNWDLINSLQEK